MHADLDCAQLLLAHSADPDMKDTISGSTSLHYVFRESIQHEELENVYQEIAKMLLQHRASLDVRNKHGETPKDILERCSSHMRHIVSSFLLHSTMVYVLVICQELIVNRWAMMW